VLTTLSGLLYIAGFVPYIVAILRGKATPQKSTWIVWSTLDLAALTAEMVSGHTSGTIIAGTVGASIVAILALIKGDKGWTKLDRFCLSSAVVGIVLWQLTNNENVGLIITLVVMLIATSATLRSAWKNPADENLLAWLLYVSGCVFGLLSVSQLTISTAAQPIVFTLIDGSVTAVILLRRYLR